MVSLDLYEKIEAEALDLFEPLRLLPLPDEPSEEDMGGGDGNSTMMKSPVDRRKKSAKTSWEGLSSTRQEKQWISPRKNRLPVSASSSKIKTDGETKRAVVQMV
jgi:hypothetical protein